MPVEVGSHYLAEGWGSQLMTVDEFMATALALRTNDDQGVCVCVLVCLCRSDEAREMKGGRPCRP